MRGCCNDSRLLRVEHDAAVTNCLRNRGRSIGNDRQAVMHGLEERRTEALMVRAADEDVAGVI